MSTEILKQSSIIFDSFEKWNAFLELRNHFDVIKNHWFDAFSVKVKQNHGFLPAELYKHWEFHFVNNGYITWNLCSAGRCSFGVGLHFHMKTPRFGMHVFGNPASRTQDEAKVAFCIGQKPEYAKLSDLCKPHSRDAFWPWAEDGVIRINDMYLSSDQLAWYCGHQLDAVTNQIMGRMNAVFLQTELFIKFNQETKKAK